MADVLKVWSNKLYLFFDDNDIKDDNIIQLGIIKPKTKEVMEKWKMEKGFNLLALNPSRAHIMSLQ